MNAQLKHVSDLGHMNTSDQPEVPMTHYALVSKSYQIAYALNIGIRMNATTNKMDGRSMRRRAERAARKLEANRQGGAA